MSPLKTQHNLVFADSEGAFYVYLAGETVGGAQAPRATLPAMLVGQRQHRAGRGQAAGVGAA
ncbi:MAG: hypothetical protein ACREX5_20950, partial [Achromobacter pestifer]